MAGVAGLGRAWVAPHAGAWIETLYANSLIKPQRVALHAGAWIETIQIKRFALELLVAPHAGRGLKHHHRSPVFFYSSVAPPCGRAPAKPPIFICLFKHFFLINRRGFVVKKALPLKKPIEEIKARL